MKISPTNTARVAPLYAAGFATAFGAHSIAAGLGSEFESLGSSVLTFGVLLAVYDIAEVILKPVFGNLSDRIGAKPVILGGLLVFTLMSFLGVFAHSALALGAVRLGQGAAASAFSPAASAAVARLSGSNTGGYFGRYGAWKTLGYVLGPLIGAGLIWWSGFPALFAFMSVISLVAACWVWRGMPALPILPKQRSTLGDLARELVRPGFVVPTMVLAAATGALGTAVGFLPMVGTSAGLNHMESMGVVSLLAICSAVIQPWVGSLRDRSKISAHRGVCLGLILIAVGLIGVAITAHFATLVICAVLVGCGVGVATPLGFAHLVSTTAPERMGRTMGSAELGREVGDAGGPILVGAIAAGAGIAAGLWSLSALVIVISILGFLILRPTKSSENHGATA